MKTYVVLKSEWESVDVVYCGANEQEALRIVEDGKYAQNNALEIWEDGKCVGIKKGTYKHDEDEY